MIRNFKALGLALLAVFAMSALVASAAQAAAGTLTTFPAGKTVDITAEQVGEHGFVLTDHPVGGAFPFFKCKRADFDVIGTVANGATTVTVTPTYSECRGILGQGATITHNECTYIFHVGTTTPTKTGWHINTAVSCPAGKAIEIHNGVCGLKIESQELNNTSEVTSSGSASPETAMDLLLHTNISGIKYSVTKDPIGCPLSGTGSFSNGDYAGTTTVKGTDATTGASVGITLH